MENNDIKSKQGERLRLRTVLICTALVAAVVCAVITLFFRSEMYTGAASRLVSILEPFIYGAVIAYLLRPICLFFEKWIGKALRKITKKKCAGFVRMTSIVLALVFLFLLLYLLIMAVIPQLISSISGLLAQLPAAISSFEEWLSGLEKGETTHEAVAAVQSAVETLTKKLQNFLETDLLPSMQSLIVNVTSSFSGILSLLKNFGLGCIVSAYFLGGWEKFKAQAKLLVYALFPKRAADWIRLEVRFTDLMFSSFIHGKVLDSAIVGLICFAFMVIARMPYALLISVIVGVTNIIPFFGPYLGAIPSVLLLLTVSPVKALVFLIFIIILQQVDGNLIGPRILGDRLGVSGFWILFSILFFSSLWGIVGMLIGVPVFAVLYDLIRRLVGKLLRRRGEEALIARYDTEFPE